MDLKNIDRTKYYYLEDSASKYYIDGDNSFTVDLRNYTARVGGFNKSYNGWKIVRELTAPELEIYLLCRNRNEFVRSTIQEQFEIF